MKRHCEKMTYRSKKEAEKHVKARWHVKRDFRLYLCEYCHGWHLTTERKGEHGW